VQWCVQSSDSTADVACGILNSRFEDGAPSSECRETAASMTLDDLAIELNLQAQKALEKFDFAAAVELLERIPVTLRNTKQWRDAVAKRDRVAEFDSLISQLVNENEFRKLASAVEAALELQPNREDLKSLQGTLSVVRNLSGGKCAGERIAIEILDLEIAFRWCPPGKFTMGSPCHETDRGADENQVPVELTTGFWLGETVVTQELYQAILDRAPSYFIGPQRPVETVSWDEAQAFCESLTVMLREQGVLAAASAASLPTEAQWEYACRAGTTTAYFFGNDASWLGQFAWFHGNSRGETHPVKSREANPWGFHDMSGNVWEWCADWFRDKLAGGENPVGPAQGSNRVARGGCWFNLASLCRSANRSRFDPSDRCSLLGFRVCLSTF
jgi:sulfatase modifying factor 1